MPKTSRLTTVTPLPAGMTRQAAVRFLQDHAAMIDLNPLVTARHRIPAPSSAPPDEAACEWWSVTDRIAYLPGGLATGSVSYRCVFLDLAGVGLQTHCYAPMGVDLRTRWSVGGSSSSSAPGGEPAELGVDDAPPPLAGLCLREDTELRCSVFMAAFVKKTLKGAHKRLVERLAQRAADGLREEERGDVEQGVRKEKEREKHSTTKGIAVQSRTLRYRMGGNCRMACMPVVGTTTTAASSSTTLHITMKPGVGHGAAELP
ncbi:hypothetical protein MY11210_009173 [Beauveria gryllotalpidicola]